jgi:hypothetical protein
MAEVGLVGFAKVGLDVARSVLPDYRSKFSKHVFTQPQLLAVVCLMPYEGWTLRKAEVRLAEHRELREALELHKAPDYTTLHRFLNRLEERVLVRALGETVRRGTHPSPHAHHDDQQGMSPGIVAVDATGLSASAISTFYVQRTQNRGGKPMLWRKWLKWLVLVDTQSQLVLAQEACSGPYNGSAMLRPLADVAYALSPFGWLLADAEFDSERNHRHVREKIGALSAIPAKRGGASWEVGGYRAEMRAEFPRKLYRRRALVESVFSAVKRKLSTRAPGRSLETQRTQPLLLGLAYNLYRLKPCSV